MKPYLLIVVLGSFAVSALAHEEESHDQKAVAISKAVEIGDEHLKAINEDYNARVKPIFQKSCLIATAKIRGFLVLSCSFGAWIDGKRYERGQRAS